MVPALALVLAHPLVALAEANCRGTVLQTTPAPFVVKAGAVLQYLALGELDDDGKPRTYEQHGGVDFPAADIHLENCHVVRQKNDDGRGFVYYLALDDTDANAQEILRTAIEAKLNSAGLDYSDSLDASEAYLTQPGGACARAAKMILAGHTEMIGVIAGTGVCGGK